MAPILTIFTPTYNRAYILHLCYESLRRQSSKDFVWLIIDDGSTDDTKLLVERWMREANFPIQYIYQENQGMHGAHNTAYENIETELNVCIDSDDYMTDEAVQKIVAHWREFGGSQYAGIVALDISPLGEIIGSRLPQAYTQATLSDLYAKHGVSGDKKLIYRTDIIKNCPPYPIYQGEKYCPLSYKYILVDQQAPLLFLDEPVCVVEYLTDGSSLNMINQYRKNPRGFAVFRKTAMLYSPTIRGTFRECIHYVSSSLIIRDRRFLVESPKKWTTVLAFPLGLLLYLYITNTKKATVMKSQSGTS